jgi:4-hydroxybenzoate polyprenyltransferase
LVVDLEGALLRADIVLETLFAELGRGGWRVARVFGDWSKGKGVLQDSRALQSDVDLANLPYDQRVLDRIRDAAAGGRAIYLTASCDPTLAEAVARRLNFDGWFTTRHGDDLTGQAKAARLTEAFGEQGFDYIGRGAEDLPVWSKAATAVAMAPSKGLRRRLAQVAPQTEEIAARSPALRDWVKLIRPHQWAKNALVFVPVLSFHHFTVPVALAAALAWVAFSLCASSVYILNDLVDVQADRAHPRKRTRPLASGAIPAGQGLAGSALLLAAAALTAYAVSPAFLGVLAGYYVLTTSYSFSLKRKMLLDVVVLAMLYAVRVIGGAVAIEAPISVWLIAFSLFIFTSLALIKRYVELVQIQDAGGRDPTNRNYRVDDAVIVATLAAASGFNAVTVFALYVSSEAAHLYTRPMLLWLVCPTLMYWIGRTLLMAHRRDLHDDPVVFALKDRVSRLTVVWIGVLVLLAI